MAQSLFRSIRMKLLDEGKTFKYLKYAIGEILLIIVGIMIALQLNNWNEERKAQVEFDEYVVQLKEDVRGAIERVSISEANNLRSIERAKYMLSCLDDPSYSLKDLNSKVEDRDKFELGLNILGRYNLPNVNIGLVGQLMAGNMDVISRDPFLSKKALQLEAETDRFLEIGEHSGDQIDLASNTINNFRGRGRSSIDGFPVRYDFEHLKGSREFIYTAVSIIETTYTVSRNCYEIGANLKDFLAVLEEYE